MKSTEATTKDRIVIGINRSWDSEYDPRCSPCWLGHAHLWSEHVRSIHAVETNDPWHRCESGQCPTVEVRRVA